MSATETNCFETLLSISPIDWINIPDPLRNGIFCIKDCISHLKDFIEKTNHLVELNSIGIHKRFEFFEENSNFLKIMIETADNNSKARISEVNESLLSELLLFKKNLAQDLDFKQKSNDKKISIMEESIFTVKRIVQCLMTPNEVEEKIKSAVKDAKQSVKSEINDFIIVPENRSINTKIDKLIEELEKVKVGSQEIVSRLKRSIEKNDEIIEERLKGVENSLGVVNDLRAKDSRNLESFYKTLKTEISANESQSNKKTAILNINFEKMQKIHVESDKKQVELKDYIRKVEEELNVYKQEMEEKLAKKPKKKSNKKKKKGKIESALESEQSDLQVNKSNSKASISISVPIEDSTEIPKIPNSISPRCVKSGEKSKPSSTSSMSKPRSPYESKHSPSPSTKKSVFCKSPENFPVDFGFEQISQSNPTIEANLNMKPADFQVIDEKISKLLSEKVSVLEKFIQSNKVESEASLKEIKDKLSWFPMNVNEMKGKNPNEARIFTIEARLRLEENARVEQYNQIVTLINTLRSELTGFGNVSNLPYLGQGRNSVRHERRLSSEGFSEYIRNLPDSEGKLHFSAFAPKPLKTFNKYTKIP